MPSIFQQDSSTTKQDGEVLGKKTSFKSMNQWAQYSAIKAASIERVPSSPQKVADDQAQVPTRGKKTSRNKSKDGLNLAKFRGKVPPLMLKSSMSKPLAPLLATERFSRKLPLLGAAGLREVFGLDSGTSPIQITQRSKDQTNKSMKAND